MNYESHCSRQTKGGQSNLSHATLVCTMSITIFLLCLNIITQQQQKHRKYWTKEINKKKMGNVFELWQSHWHTIHNLWHMRCIQIITCRHSDDVVQCNAMRCDAKKKHVYIVRPVWPFLPLFFQPTCCCVCDDIFSLLILSILFLFHNRGETRTDKQT